MSKEINMSRQYIDPVNYNLTLKDLNITNYESFLDDLTDVPSSTALKPYSIDRAGISEQSAYVKVMSINDENKYVPMFIKLKMQVELKGHRGIHMSRCEEALFSLLQDKHESLVSFTEKLAKEILNLQGSNKSYISAEGTYIHQRLTKKTNKSSYDKIYLYASSAATCNNTESKIGISAYNMTGCPCTETFTKFAIVPKLKESGYSLKQIKEILAITNSGTHTQRGLATIIVDKNNSNITYGKLYQILDQSCHLVYELLKRPDEHELVVRVLNNPQFTEDVVRDIVASTVDILGKNLNISSEIFASSQLYDSIHIHDVYTEITKTYGQICSENE
jgi:MptA/FolE2 family GTP cyclohydrolase